MKESAVQWFAYELGIKSGSLLKEALQKEKEQFLITDQALKDAANEYARDNVEWFICFLDGAEWYKEQIENGL